MNGIPRRRSPTLNDVRSGRPRPGHRYSPRAKFRFTLVWSGLVLGVADLYLARQPGAMLGELLPFFAGSLVVVISFLAIARIWILRRG